VDFKISVSIYSIYHVNSAFLIPEILSVKKKSMF